MAELHEKFSVQTGKRTRKNTHVDLTPMVDLGFLLITFFIFSSVISQPTVTNLIMPKDNGEDSIPITEKAVLTLDLLQNDSISYYEGRRSDALPQYCNYKTLRSIINWKQQFVAKNLGDKDETVLIIHPTVSCTYKNFMDVIDEIYINDIKHYFILSGK